jgi:hypothetical protein
MKTQRKPSNYVIGPQSRIGMADAQNDAVFLQSCFVDSGLFADVMRFDSPRFIILGRTGSGKTALIQRLLNDRPNNTVVLDPQQLALSFIENSNIVNWLINNDINIDTFFQTLWQHIMSIEILRKRYDVSNEYKTNKFLESIEKRIAPNKYKAMKYLERFKDTFWKDTELRVADITTRFEEAVRFDATLMTDFPASSISTGAGGGSSRNISKEKKEQFESRINNVIGADLLSGLNDIFSVLMDEFKNPQYALYVAIDDLDLAFAGENIRIRLVRALLDCLKRMHKIPYVKFNVAMRDDLLAEALGDSTRIGFQVEKYEDHILPVRWNASQLFELVDKRIHFMTCKDPNKTPAQADSLGFYDLFPKEVRQKKTREYMITRTLHRPRDLIKFVNDCLTESQGKKSVSAADVITAESSYSKSRIDSLINEWRQYMPDIRVYISILEQMPFSFTLDELIKNGKNQIQSAAVSLADESRSEPIVRAANAMFENYKKDLELESDYTRRFVELVLDKCFTIGLIGVRHSEGSNYEWADASWKNIRTQSWSMSTKIQIHKMYSLALRSKTIEA